MEFKNFENKLIIEKITNYCIENNINAQQINALTAKIKFGKLNESILLEFIDPISGTIAGAAGAALGAGGLKKAWNWGMDKIGGTGGFTSTQKYNSAKKLIQDKLQTAITSVDSVVNDLDETKPDNIFKKYSITLGDAEKQDLINAVREFQTTLNSDIVKNVKTSLEKIGGNVSGSSNFGDGSSINFDLAFPELKDGGALDTAFNTAFPSSPAEIKKLKPQIKSNINASIKGKDPLQVNSIMKKFKDSLADAVVKLKSTAATKDEDHQSGYSNLVSLANGRFPADNNNPTATTPAPAPSTAVVKAIAYDLADGEDFTPEIATGFKNSSDLKNLIKDLLTQGKTKKEIENSFANLTNDANFENFLSGVGTAVPATDVARKVRQFVLKLKSSMGL